MKGFCCFTGLGNDADPDPDPLQGNFALDGGEKVSIQEFRCQCASKTKSGQRQSSNLRRMQGDGNKKGKIPSRNKSSKIRGVEREVPGVAHGSRTTVPPHWYTYYCRRMREIPAGLEERVPRAPLAALGNTSNVSVGDDGKMHQCIRTEKPLKAPKNLESNVTGMSLAASVKEIEAQYLLKGQSGHQTFPQGKKKREPPYIPPLDFRRLPGSVYCHPKKSTSSGCLLDPPMKLTHLRHDFTLRWMRDEEDDIVAELKDSSGLTPVWKSSNIMDLFSSQISPARMEEGRQNSMTDSLKSFGEELVFNMMSPVPCFRNSCPKTRRPVGSKSSHQGSYSMAASDSVSTYAPEVNVV